MDSLDWQHSSNQVISSQQNEKMSSWDRVQRLPEAQQQEIQLLYGAHMPVEVRRALCEWIDKYDWQTLNPDSSVELNQYMIALADQFMCEVEVSTVLEVV